MSFLLDPPALFIIGLLAAKIHYLSVVFGDRFFIRGASRRNLLIFGSLATLIFWAYSSLLYIDAIYFPWPLPKWFGGTDWMLNSGLPLGWRKTSATDFVAIVIFATYPLWYYLGSELGLAGFRISQKQRSKERNRIVTEVVRTAFPRGGAIPPGAQDVDAAKSVIELFGEIPPIFQSALTMLLFVFDSRFFVLAFTGKWSRFVDLDRDRTSTREKRKYMEVWQSNPFLVGAAQILKLISSFGYYTKQEVWKSINYAGPSRPNEPPWYRTGQTMQPS